VRVCVVGSGGREHALAVALARTAEVVVTPGNAGMERWALGVQGFGSPSRGGKSRADGPLESGLGDAARNVRVTAAPPEEVEADLFVVGPEAPLVDGLADRLRADRRLVVGPGADGARLEGSKAYMKELLAEAGVPTARFGVFDEVQAAREFLGTLPPPYVVKTDGLASGKGVLVTDSLAEALADVEAKLSGRAFGEAGRRVVVEEGLEGVECSVMVLCDGKQVVPLAPARDFKRLADGDEGPNTGGMGAYSPLPDVDDRLVDQVMEEAVEPLVGALRKRGVDYRGVLYAGLMLTGDGPRVLEYNVRFGDPEAQVILPRLSEDLTALMAEVAAGRLRTEPRFDEGAAVCVVLAAEGYPMSPRSGEVIEGIDDAAEVEGAWVFHAGSGVDAAGLPVVAGGRVLDVVGSGRTLSIARKSAYEAVGRISWKGMQARKDIAEAAARGAEAAVASGRSVLGGNRARQAGR